MAAIELHRSRPEDRPEVEPIGGLVWGFAFDEEGNADLLSDEDAAIRVASRAGRLWLHFNITDSRARLWLSERAPIDPIGRELLLSGSPRQQILTHGQEVYGVVSDFQMEFDRDRTLEIGRLRFALTDRIIISARQHPLQSIERLRHGLGEGRRLPEVGLFLEMVIDGFLTAAADTMEGLGEEIDEIEDAIIAGKGDAGKAGIGAVRRAALRLHREISPLRSALRHILDGVADRSSLQVAVARTAPRLIARLDAADHDLHALGDRARLIRDELSSIAVDRTNNQLFVLSVLSALFLPATLVTGVFGMNAKDLPLQQTDNGFWFAMLICLAATLSVFGLLYRRGVLR